MVVDKGGDLPDFFEVYSSQETKAKVLSFADVEDLYEITYKQEEAFMVHMENKDLVFKCRKKIMWQTCT
jgi:hypothetical protein